MKFTRYFWDINPKTERSFKVFGLEVCKGFNGFFDFSRPFDSEYLPSNHIVILGAVLTFITCGWNS
jgi:hypothetical protein